MKLEFTPDGIEALADIAFEVNRTTQNIGARRLHTILERVVEDISFEGPDLTDKQVVIDGTYVRSRLERNPAEGRPEQVHPVKPARRKRHSKPCYAACGVRRHRDQ